MFDFSKRIDNNIELQKSKIMNNPTNIQEQEILRSRMLLTGVSHELRTHMNAIVAFSFLLKDQTCDANERDQFSDHIVESCEQLVTLFDNFLDSAAVDTGNSQSVLRRCNLQTIIKDLQAEFRVMVNKKGSEISINFEADESFRGDIHLEPDRLTRVIQNLFRNALQNTTSGYIKIGYFFRENKVTFYVLDSGQGYFKSKELLQAKNINEFLFKHNDTYTTVSLTLARKLVYLMGGEIWIEQNGLSGTGIYFSLPCQPARVLSPNENEVNRKIAI